MSLLAYKVLHILGLSFVLIALGGAITHVANGGTKASNRVSGLIGAVQGVGLVILLVAGFGMLAKLGIMGSMPGWVWAKIVLWLVFGAALAIPNRKPELAKPLFFLLPVLAGVGAWLAIYKPF